jgi:hypothetical protein
MGELKAPDFETYEDEAEFWDKLDTADFMPDDDEWFRFEIVCPVASEASLPDTIRVNP